MATSHTTSHVSFGNALGNALNRLPEHGTAERRSSFNRFLYTVASSDVEPVLEVVFPHDRQGVARFVKLIFELLQALREIHDEISSHLVEMLFLRTRLDELEDLRDVLMQPMGINAGGVHASCN
jgi:hypothetical protein